MKRKMCMMCFEPAVYESQNSNLRLCEDCYCSMADDYSASFEEEYGMSFDEYYDIEEIENDD